MGKSILITGTSSGFGELMVKTLAKEGHTVFATMRNTEGKNAEKKKALQDWANQRNYEVHVLELDVTDEASVNNAVKQAIEIADKIDVVVNNAGYAIMGILESVTPKQAQQQFDVNVFGVQRVNRAVLPHMRNQQSGLLIHISSGLGRVVMPFMGIYTATKFAVEALALTYHYELKKFGIDSVIIQPGAYPTEFAAKGSFAADQQRTNGYGEVKTAMDNMFSGWEEMFKQAGDPQEIADAVKEYVDMEPGTRPLHIARGMMSEGAAVINKTVDEVQKQIEQNMGI